MKRRFFILATAGLAYAALCAAGPSQTGQAEQKREEGFQAAVAQYEAGHYGEAVAPLERLVKEVPESFDVHELLGLVYAAQSEDLKANEHLAKAVRLKPDSAAARSNLAASYAKLGKLDQAQEQFSKAVELEPNTFDTNHNLGEMYVRRGMVAKAVPYLEKAQRIDAASYDNGYDLTLAYMLSGRLSDARNSAKALLKTKETGEAHNLLAQIEEKDGNSIAAANEFQAAARLEPSESNLFDWGGELLVHRTLDPAVQVFEEGARRFPNSPRLMV
jgi:Tfp pilus assembly protein PilF